MKVITRVPIQGQNFQQPALSVKIPVKVQTGPGFKVTTKSGYSWICRRHENLADARAQYIGRMFDISRKGQGALFDDVVSVEPVS